MATITTPPIKRPDKVIVIDRTTIPLTFGENKIELLFKSPSNTEALLIQTCFKDLLHINRSIRGPAGNGQESGRSSSGFIS